MVGMGHALHHLLKGDVPVSVLRKQNLVRLIREESDAVVHAGGVLRMGIQPVHLTLKLFRIVPVIIPLAQGDIFSSGCREEHQVVNIHPPGVEILLLIKRPDHLGVFRRVFPDNVPVLSVDASSFTSTSKGKSVF